MSTCESLALHVVTASPQRDRGRGGGGGIQGINSEGGVNKDEREGDLPTGGYFLNKKKKGRVNCTASFIWVEL